MGIVKKVLMLLLLSSCSTIKYIPVETTKYVKDSVIVKDSIVFRDTCIVKDYVLLPDTLIMTTPYSKSTSWVDTTHKALKGELIDLPHKLEYKTIETVRDSIVYEQVPMPVEVEKSVNPKWCWYSLIANIIIFLIFLLKIAKRFCF